ncbi:MAG: TIGR04013 family B12-binding domain/radical SAM domain-containing protein [Candidatus Schekmanbacteria bacterium]|nr:TIGR04013 family B12-binding domain/radical SAM domain-containing protein [Candidatus Schekmanbacteria bacterium]
MKKNTALLFYYNKENRYGINALAGSIECCEDLLQDIDIVFPYDEDVLYKTTEKLVKSHEKIILCFSFFTTQLWDIKRMLNKLRKDHGKHIHCIAGGPHPTGAPAGTLAMGFDVVALGEGEGTLRDIVSAIKNDGNLSDVKGIAYIDDKKNVCYNAHRPPLELDSFTPFSVKYNKIGPIEITRGCRFSCSYCQTPNIFPGKPRHRSVETIFEYVEIMKKLKRKTFRFISPDALSYGSPDGRKVNLAKIYELLSGVRKISGKSGRIIFGFFPSEIRPEHVTTESMELITRFTHNNRFAIGAQSGSERMLERCRRGHTVDDIYNAARIIKGAGKMVIVDFIFGMPGETAHDIQDTIKVMRDLVDMDATIHAHTFTPLPATPFANEPAGKVSPEVIAAVNSFMPSGRAFGDWQAQEQMAGKIAEYLQNTQIKQS